MVEQPTRYRSYEPGIDSLEQDITALRPRPHRSKSYAFGRSAEPEYQEGESVPLFLSDPDGEPDPAEFEYGTSLHEPRRLSLSAKILLATVAASAVAVTFAWFSSDAMRDVMISAKASIATVFPSPSVAAQPDATRLTAHDVQLKDPTRLTAPASQSPAPANPQQVAALPSREAITSAYQAAMQNHAPAAAPQAIIPSVVTPAAAAVPPAQPPRQIGADELANLMQRAKGFLDTGDLPSARLLLQRAADASDAGAALLLAQTYDPEVLGTSDVRNIVAEPAKARAWYQKAAELGSADAQRRLAQLPN
jgi:hypothetical protein